MTPVNLRKLLSRDKEATAMLQAVIGTLDSPVWIEDVSGQLLLGSAGEPSSTTPGDRYPLTSEEQIVGYVVGSSATRTAGVAALASYVLNRETAEKNLGREVLDKYREINLLYELSEKLSLSLDLAAVAGVAAGEAQRLIKKGSGVVLLRGDQETEAGNLFTPLIANALVPRAGIQMSKGIIGSVAQNDRAEIVNDAAEDPRRSSAESALRSLMGVPLKARQRVIGLIVLGSTEILEYTAADLKFLVAIASQAAPAIENALFYEKTVRAAREREEKLQQQLAELQIEIDKTRQAKQVAEITGTEYFKSLREQAKGLRSSFDSSG